MLYVHIPFCAHKCHYCDFNSHVRTEPLWQSYADALAQELIHWSGQHNFKGRPVSSVFIGGGTPSLMPPPLLASLIATIQSCFSLDPQAEITIEANPGSSDQHHFSDYRNAGINRISIGVQSLDAEELRWLERIHSPDEALAAFQAARAAGFTNVNLDAMYGLPGQTLDHWQQTLHRLIQLNPEHLSCYQLTVEPHTRLAAQHAQSPYALPQEEASLAFFHYTRHTLRAFGYQPYEISNFSRSGYHCRHNDGYWLYRDYLGIGAGASGKWDEWEHDKAPAGCHRYTNIKTPEKYIRSVQKNGFAIRQSETLDLNQAAAEAIWLGLRRKDGIDKQWFEDRFQQPLAQFIQPALTPWLISGDVRLNNAGIQLSEQGIVLADSISAAIL